MSTIGCVNGKLEDPQAYFFFLLSQITGKTEAAGLPCPNWKANLELLPSLGMQVNVQPGAPIPADAKHYGICIMIDAGGNARGRCWLPTEQHTTDGNGNKWFTHEMQVIAERAGVMYWAWDDKGGPPYVARVCDSGSQPPNPNPPPSQLEARVEQLENVVKALTENTVEGFRKVSERFENLVVPQTQTEGKSLPVFGTHSHTVKPQKVVDGREG
jgi:hypothetical protein